jgi:CPA2 family monovalent cation:H+ antiporter-2
LDEQASYPHLREILVFLGVAGIAVPFLGRLRIPPVLGFLAIGALLGPFGLSLFHKEWPALGWVTIGDVEGVRAIADLGIVFLLFMIGLDLSLRRLWEMRGLVLGLGIAQIAACAAGLALLAMLLGVRPIGAGVIGSALALSSTAIVMEILTRRRAVGSAVGRSAFAILLMQDLAVIPLLVLIGAAGSSGEDAGESLLWALASAVVAVGLIALAARFVVRPLFRLVAGAGSREMFMAATLLVVAGTAGITAAAGLSMALGAFLAGLALAETEYRHSIEADIEPFKGLLMGLFFLSVGMGIDFRLVAAAPLTLLGATLGVILLKAVIIAGLCRLFRQWRPAAIETGFLLGQAGEFGFVVVGLAAAQGLLDPAHGQAALIVISLSMAATPAAAKLGRRIAAMARRDMAAAIDSEVPADLSGHVVIAGYGRVGRMVGRILDDENVPWIAIEHDAEAVADLHGSDATVIFGDADRAALLSRAGAENAQAVIVTLDDAEAAARAVAAVHQHWPDKPIFARARDEAAARQLSELGAKQVVPEVIEGALQLAARLLEGIGMPEEAVDRRIDHARRRGESAGQ